MIHDILGKFITIALFLALLFGYANNLLMLVSLDFDKPYKAEAIRTLGVFVPPVGVICGYVTFEEERYSYDRSY